MMIVLTFVLCHLLRVLLNLHELSILQVSFLLLLRNTTSNFALAGDQGLQVHGAWRLPYLDYPTWLRLACAPRHQLLGQPSHLQPFQF